MTKMFRYLIIGNSAGGIGAAEAIRAVDKQGSLAIVSDEPYPAYSRPLISEYLAEKCSLERMLLRPADFYEKSNISTFLGKKVERLDTDEHVIELNSGEKIFGEKLLLATGGLPIVPQIKGINRQGVFTFTTLNDARLIDQFLNRNRATRAVVVGGGLIGVSVTEALVKREIKVSIVEMKERILNTILDEEASALEAQALSRAGVNIITGHTLAEISSYSGDMVTGVILDDGSPIPCNLVIFAIGVRPRTELVSDRIKINHGIVVNRYMATSCPNVYACGDAAEAYDFVYGEPRLTPIWPSAYIGGRVAGFNMAGITTEYPGGTAMNSLKYFGLDIASAGIVNPPDDSYDILSEKHNTYHKVILKDGLVVGMVFVGNIEKSGIVLSLIRDKVNTNGFKQVLASGNFGLASLPEEIWRPQLEVPPSGLSLPLPLKPPEEIILGE